MNKVSKSILIGTIVGVFFVGMGVSYAVFTSTSVLLQMTDEEHIRAMIYEPEIHEAMMKMMTEDEEHSIQMFKDMTATSMQKHEFAQKVMGIIESDSEFRMHVMAHLMQDEDFMNQMQLSSP